MTECTETEEVQNIHSLTYPFHQQIVSGKGRRLRKADLLIRRSHRGNGEIDLFFFIGCETSLTSNHWKELSIL